ncbi:unnamed protein product [Vicia faba]|uniref:Uncharacterized protein n=1 Tax=Vicia faba TaxID=3906 RepID=A0AAV1AGH0_VICFA|nr:unnamed protein product [Vicia faba]
MKRKVMAIEKINAYIQKLDTMEKKFNPLPHFTLHNVLSQISPQFYSKDELTQIEKINQIPCQEENFSLISQSKVERVEVNNKKRYRSSNEDIISDGERKVKLKSAIRKPIIRREETLVSPPPDLPSHVNNMIKVLNDTDIKYIMYKELFKYNLNYNLKRLSMPCKN